MNEIFGTSEDESAFDHSADAENAKEIEELKRESEALRKIRNSVGSPEFPQMLFDKVFSTDILRLRSMEDMWKTRKPPEPLDYATVYKQAEEKGVLANREAVLKDDQRVWTLEENLVVFIDSLERLSKRVQEMRAAGDAEAIITFDKDDEDTLDFVASAANIRSTLFGIDRKSKFDIKQMAGNIIPAIATTNAIVAGLCVLEAFKVLRGEYDKVKEVFLTPFAPARLLASDKARMPNPECPVCGVFQTRAYVDLSRATLNDLIENFVKMELGFGEKEISVSNEVGILYDPDETDNLDKKLTDLGPLLSHIGSCIQGTELTVQYRHQARLLPNHNRRRRRKPLRECRHRHSGSVRPPSPRPLLPPDFFFSLDILISPQQRTTRLHAHQACRTKRLHQDPD